jgi:hypothetical protein
LGAGLHPGGEGQFPLCGSAVVDGVGPRPPSQALERLVQGVAVEPEIKIRDLTLFRGPAPIISANPVPAGPVSGGSLRSDRSLRIITAAFHLLN